MSLKQVVGLFGTCGASRWREDVVIPILEAEGVEYFNPVVPHWNEEAQKNEAEHGATDRVIMLVITGETTGIASMAESGWLATQGVLRGQTLVMVLQDMETEPDPSLRINKTRALLRRHIAALPEGTSVVLFDDIAEAARYAASVIHSL